MAHEFHFQNILKEAFENYQKNSEEDPSLRGFAKFLGINSGTLFLIFKGERSLNSENAKKVAERLNLSPLQKKTFLNSIAEYKGRKLQDDSATFPKAETLELPAKDFLQLIEEPLYFKFIHLLRKENFQPDMKWISEQLQISDEKLNSIVSKLEELKIIENLGDGRWVCKFGAFYLATCASSKEVMEVREKEFELSQNFSKDLQDAVQEITACILTVDPSQICQAKEVIERFKDDLKLLSSNSEAQNAYLFSLQMHLLD